MTIIYFDLAVLSAKADELEGLNERLLGEITTMNETESALAGMWEGPAKESFRQAYERDAVQMKNFYNAIRVYIEILRLLIANYRAIESQNEMLGQQRTYGGCGC